MAAYNIVLLLLSALCSVAFTHNHPEGNVAYKPGQCLRGDRHRELACPQPEGPDYQACFQWSEDTCCTANFTEQLAGATVRNIDGFHWSRCDPPLSQQCEDYFRRVECFYRCSPNVAHWALDEFPSALAGLPVCANFCDEWFDACASDMTCATNWITDWLYVNGINQCMDDAVCRNFSDVYGDGRGLCNTLWGQSFVYTDQSPGDPDRTCLSPWWPLNETNPNSVAVRNNFGSLVDTVTAPPCNVEGSGSSRVSASVAVVSMLVASGKLLLG